MLLRMRLLLPAVLILCCATTATSTLHGQIKLPKLEELGEADMLKQQQGLLTTPQISLLKRVTSRAIQQCVADPGPEDAITAAETYSQLRARRINLSSNRTAVIVQGSRACMCGAVGNCSLWLLSDDVQPKLLLRAVGIQNFATQVKPNKGGHDLVLGSHDSAFQSDLQWYRSNGVTFRRYRCATATWSDLDGKLCQPPHVDVGPCL